MNDFDDCDTTDVGDTDAFELYLEQSVDSGCGPPLGTDMVAFPGAGRASSEVFCPDG